MTDSQELISEDSDGDDDSQSDADVTGQEPRIGIAYTDLHKAIEVAEAVYKSGRTSSTNIRVAALLDLQPGGGNFRLRLYGAKAFGLVTSERGGVIKLTPLGIAISSMPPAAQRIAKVKAFFNIELFRVLFSQFKDEPLLIREDVDEAIKKLGISTKSALIARQVFIRSARQAGFFRGIENQLILSKVPSDQILGHRDSDQLPEFIDNGESHPANNRAGRREFDHPLIAGLFETLPPKGAEWESQERLNWLRTADHIFKLIYKQNSNHEIAIDHKEVQAKPQSH